MKFKYVAVNEDGDLVGTNNKGLAQYLSDEDGLYVYDVTTGLSLDSSPQMIEEAEDTRPEEEDGEESGEEA